MCSNDDSGHIEKLVDGNGFQLWKFEIQIFFKASNVWDIVNGGKNRRFD